MRYLCKKSGSGVKNTLIFIYFSKEIRKVNHTHCILLFSKRGICPLRKRKWGETAHCGVFLGRSPLPETVLMFTSAFPEREKSELYRLGFGGSRWWSFGLNRVTTQIEVWLRFDSCAWLVGCWMFGENKGTEHCKDRSASPPNSEQALGTHLGSVRGRSLARYVDMSSRFSHQQPRERQGWEHSGWWSSWRYPGLARGLGFGSQTSPCKNSRSPWSPPCPQPPDPEPW